MGSNDSYKFYCFADAQLGSIHLFRIDIIMFWRQPSSSLANNQNGNGASEERKKFVRREIRYHLTNTGAELFPLILFYFISFRFSPPVQRLTWFRKLFHVETMKPTFNRLLRSFELTPSSVHIAGEILLNLFQLYFRSKINTMCSIFGEWYLK